jgi:glycosyltransferase involved in cell wall biosynthesis
VVASVVRLATRLNVGGPAHQCLLLTKALADEFPTTLAAGRPPDEEGELTDPAVPVRRVPLTRPLAPAADLRALVAVRALLREVRPTILHTHMAKAGTVGRVAAATVRPRPLTIHTFHGHVLDGYFRQGVQQAFLKAERILARRTDVLIAVSPQVRDDLLALGIGTPDRWRVVPLGLPLDAFAAIDGPSGRLRERLRLAADVPLVGALGRIVPIKDLATLVRAVARLPDVHLALIGDGSERAELAALVGSLGVADRVHLTGWADDVPAWVADLDVVALTSRNEGTPVALIEALAAGRPVVATSVGGVPFVVREGVTGWLVPPADPVATAEALAACLGDRTDAAARAAAGRAEVLARFPAERLVADVRALYRELTG